MFLVCSPGLNIRRENNKEPVNHPINRLFNSIGAVETLHLSYVNTPS